MASLQSALLAFGIAKVAKWKMSVEENVFIQTVAVAVGTMPLAAGFVGKRTSSAQEGEYPLCEIEAYIL